MSLTIVVCSLILNYGAYSECKELQHLVDEWNQIQVSGGTQERQCQIEEDVFLKTEALPPDKQPEGANMFLLHRILRWGKEDEPKCIDFMRMVCASRGKECKFLDEQTK